MVERRVVKWADMLVPSMVEMMVDHLVQTKVV